MSWLSTPSTPRPLWLLLAVLVIIGPVLDIAERYNPDTGYVYVPLGLDALTVTPFFWVIFWSMAGLPLAAAAWAAQRVYAGRVTLLRNNRERPLWTIALSVISALAISSIGAEVLEHSSGLWQSAWALRALLWAYWFLSIRAVLVGSTIFAGPGPVSRTAA